MYSFFSVLYFLYFISFLFIHSFPFLSFFSSFSLTLTHALQVESNGNRLMLNNILFLQANKTYETSVAAKAATAAVAAAFVYCALLADFGCYFSHLSITTELKLDMGSRAVWQVGNRAKQFK